MIKSSFTFIRIWIISVVSASFCLLRSFILLQKMKEENKKENTRRYQWRKIKSEKKSNLEMWRRKMSEKGETWKAIFHEKWHNLSHSFSCLLIPYPSSLCFLETLAKLFKILSLRVNISSENKMQKKKNGR